MKRTASVFQHFPEDRSHRRLRPLNMILKYTIQSRASVSCNFILDIPRGSWLTPGGNFILLPRVFHFRRRNSYARPVQLEGIHLLRDLHRLVNEFRWCLTRDTGFDGFQFEIPIYEQRAEGQFFARKKTRC